jgi:hypothetical protein
VAAGIIDELVLVIQSHVGDPRPSRARIPVEEAANDARRMLVQGRGVPRTQSWLRKCASSHPVSD